MTISQYHATTLDPRGRNYGFSFEHSDRDLDELAELVAQDGVVTVSRLKTVDDSKGGRCIIGRDRVIIGAASIETIQIPHARHWEVSEAA